MRKKYKMKRRYTIRKKNIMRKKYNVFNFTIILIYLILFLLFSVLVFSQTIPGFAFINFTMRYDDIIKQLNNSSFEVKEDEIAAKFGNYLIQATKVLTFYKEVFYLFFNEKKELIYFEIDFSLNNLQSRVELEKLFYSVKKKLEDKYGESENENFPYFKNFENKFQIILYPLFPGNNKIKITYKCNEKYESFLEYYKKAIEKDLNNEINSIINNF